MARQLCYVLRWHVQKHFAILGQVIEFLANFHRILITTKGLLVKKVPIIIILAPHGKSDLTV